MSTRGKQIAFSVVMAHALILAMLGADHWMHRTPQRKKVTVNTFVLSPPPIAAAVATSAPKTTTAAAPKKAPATKPTAKTASKPSAAEASLFSEIEKSLDSLTAVNSSVKKSNIDIPAFNFEPQTPRIEYSAAEQIAALLQETLELPEFGEVKMKLSINRFGALEKLEIVEAKSQKNGEFLKKRLPELQFPCLNEATTLTIVFSNAL